MTFSKLWSRGGHPQFVCVCVRSMWSAGPSTRAAKWKWLTKRAFCWLQSFKGLTLKLPIGYAPYVFHLAEDTASSLQTVLRGRRSQFINRRLSYGMAKNPVDYLAAVQRWAEGGVVLSLQTFFSCHKGISAHEMGQKRASLGPKTPT